MKNILLAPDSFKGSLSANEVVRAMEQGIRRVWPDAAVTRIPMADGGEGTLDAVLAAVGGQRHTARVTGADFKSVDAEYGLIQRDSHTVAILETSQVVGFSLAGTHPVAERTTLGLGELVLHCLDQGVRHFMIGLGGSSTNDGGAGVLAALGVRLLNLQGKIIMPTPQGLSGLVKVDFSAVDARLKESEIVLMSDVRNPLCGAGGATAIFGPQKGVAAQDVAVVDGWLRGLADLCDAACGHPVSMAEGAGAAGGLGFAFQLLGGKSRSGAEVMCEFTGFDVALAQADWVITGEGRSDAQTLLGKVPYVVAEHARRSGVPVVLVSGGIDQAALPQLTGMFDSCFSITFQPVSLQEAMAGAAIMVSNTLEQIARLVAVASKPDTKH